MVIILMNPGGRPETMMPEIWTEKYMVGSFQTDYQGRLHLHSMAQLFQESAWRHADACGAGYDDLLRYGKFWVLAGLKIKIMELPVWGEKIILNTWGNDIDGLFAFRDYEITDLSGKLRAAASSSWLIIDHITHHPSRITDEFRKIPCRGVFSVSGKPGRLRALKSGVLMDTIKVQYSDIDVQNHVNNARYIEWCVNRLALSAGNDHLIDGLEINYLNECQLGHEIRFLMEKDPGSDFHFSARNLGNGKEVFRASLSIRKTGVPGESAA
jgi:acyl-ACP thioesterase